MVITAIRHHPPPFWLELPRIACFNRVLMVCA
jgi:hypothetical protein